jgi:hypothetical protein
MMDRKTSFLLASRLSQHRNVNGAVAVFNEARRNANGSEPDKIFADGLSAYPQALTYWEGGSPRPELVARMRVGKPHANKQPHREVERHITRAHQDSEGMEDDEDPTRGGAENPIQLREASHGARRSDARSGRRDRPGRGEQVDGTAKEGGGDGMTIRKTAERTRKKKGKSAVELRNDTLAGLENVKAHPDQSYDDAIDELLQFWEENRVK